MKLVVPVLAALLAASPGVAQSGDRNERVQFDPGASSREIADTLTGYNGVNYIVAVTAGQKMTVVLDTDNDSNYFNIWAPDADSALFVGSTNGNSYTFQVPLSGDYRVQVYLMRNAARRNERANYTLDIKVEQA